MQIYDLFEMPIANITRLGNWDKSSSFKHLQDRKLLTNPKAVEKIKGMWNHVETEFNIILINHPEVGYHAPTGRDAAIEVGFVSHDWLEDRFKKLFPEIEPLLHNDKVNIIYTNNNGSERVPMTGWIMAHRFGHALLANRLGKFRLGKFKSYYMMEADQEFTRVTNQMMEFYNIPIPNNRYGPSLSMNGPILGFLREVCTFKAARDNAIRNPYEALFDCLAQYMITGKITFKDIPRSFKYGPHRYEFNGGKDYDYFNHGYKDDLANTLEELFQAAIGYSEGSILVM